MNVRGGISGLLVAALAMIPGHAGGVVYYNVTFGSPPHTVGFAPATGAGTPPRVTVSRVIQTGSLLDIFVTDSHGPLTEQPLEFNSGSTIPSCQLHSDCPSSFCDTDTHRCFWAGDSVRFDLFDLDVGCPLTIQADLVVTRVENAIRPFVVTFSSLSGGTDAGIAFRSDGHIVSRASYGDPVDIGTFTFGTLMQIRIIFVGSAWQIFADGTLLQSGQAFPGGTRLRHVSVGLPPPPPPPADIVAAIDNVMIFGGGKDTDCDGKADTCDPLITADCQAVLDCHVTNWSSAGAQRAASQQCAQLNNCSGNTCVSKCQALLDIMADTTQASERQWLVDFCNAVVPGEDFR
jgi:hypothetical protein